MKHRLLLAALLSFSALTPARAVDERYPGYEVRPELAGEASVAGAPAPASLMLLWPESFRMAQQGVALRTGTTDGSIRIKAAVEAIAILVNAENPLTCISLDTLHALYTEENPQWEAGGAVTPLARRTEPGESDFFVEDVLGSAPFSAGVTRVARYSDLLDRLSAASGGIGYAPAGYRGDGVKALQLSNGGACAAPSASAAYRAEYPLARFVELEGDRNEVSLAFFDYVLSQEGQRDAVIAGFYSLPFVYAAEERKKLGLD